MFSFHPFPICPWASYRGKEYFAVIHMLQLDKLGCPAIGIRLEQALRQQSRNSEGSSHPVVEIET